MQTASRRTKSKQKYSRVSTTDNDDQYDDTTFDGVTPNLSNIGRMGHGRAESKSAQWSQKINTLIHSFFWIGLAIFIIQYCDLVRVLRIDERVILPCLYLAAISWLGVILLFAYLGLWLPIVRKQRIEDYNVTHANHIKFTLALTGISVLFFIISIWNIWRWVSIPITFCLLMGCMMIPNILPNF